MPQKTIQRCICDGTKTNANEAFKYMKTIGEKGLLGNDEVTEYVNEVDIIVHIPIVSLTAKTCS